MKKRGETKEKRHRSGMKRRVKELTVTFCFVASYISFERVTQTQTSPCIQCVIFRHDSVSEIRGVTCTTVALASCPTMLVSSFTETSIQHLCVNPVTTSPALNITAKFHVRTAILPRCSVSTVPTFPP